MSAIVTITFNPAIDKSSTVEALIPEKKMHCTSPFYEPGGGGINVSRAIKKLGGQSTAIYLAGGQSGKTFTFLLSQQKVKSVLIKTKENTRENLMVLETSTKKQFRFGMPGPNVFKKEWQLCLKHIKNLDQLKYLVISGSLAPNMPTDIIATIAEIVKKKKARLLIDSSGETLKKALEVGVYLIKPNLRELSSIVGKEEISIEEVEETAKSLIEKGKCKIIVVSMGALGAMLVTKDNAYQIKTPTIILKSTVGAGDSMLAGMALSLLKGKTMLEVLQYGVACGTAATMNPGTELCHKKDVDLIFKIIQKQKSV
jgi:6-phosphofructokinase 2